MTQWGSTTPSYDLNGNTLNDGVNSYVWDARNRMASANNNGASFSYDPLGRRMGKTILSANTNYLYDGANPVQELNGATPTANLLTGGIDERFTRTDSTGTSNFITDALGSTLALTDSAGNQQTQYTYDPFGNMSVTGPASTNSYTYTGRETDGLGINYYRARYYNPTTGRFLSEDPAGFRGGINKYAYVSDSPTDFIDPFGLCPATPKQRRVQALNGLLNLGIAGGKLAVAAAMTGGTGGLGIALGAYSAVSSMGNLGAGLSQLMGAATGDVEAGEEGAEASSVAVSLFGVGTLIATNGNLGKASTAASLEGVMLTPATAGFTGDSPSIPDLADLGQNINGLANGDSNKSGTGNGKCPCH